MDLTPKDKAKELYDKMGEGRSIRYSEITFAKESKHTALVAVKEILSTLYEFHYDSNSGAYEYWQEVETELKNNY